jgi:hypothetical protein
MPETMPPTAQWPDLESLGVVMTALSSAPCSAAILAPVAINCLFAASACSHIKTRRNVMFVLQRGQSLWTLPAFRSDGTSRAIAALRSRKSIMTSRYDCDQMDGAPTGSPVRSRFLWTAHIDFWTDVGGVTQVRGRHAHPD